MNPYKASFNVILAAVVGATLLQVVSLTMSENAIVSFQTYDLTAADKGKTLSSRPFRLEKEGNIEIDTTSYLNNDWLELDMALVNTDTNQGYPVFQALDHYSGQDSDGAWEEGSYDTTSLLPPVPPGTYQLLVEPDAGVFSKASSLAQRVVISVRHGVPVWSNYLIAMALLLVVPAFGLVKRSMFEKSRWEKGGVAE